MENTVTVRVTNKQRIDNATDTIEEQGTGTFRIKNKKHYIIYQTTTDGDSSKVTIIADKDSVHIKRTGSSQSDMIYNSGQKTSCIYHTPYGNINMEINTIRIHNRLSEGGGSLKIVYALTMQGMYTYNDTEIIIG